MFPGWAVCCEGCSAFWENCEFLGKISKVLLVVVVGVTFENGLNKSSSESSCFFF